MLDQELRVVAGRPAPGSVGVEKDEGEVTAAAEITVRDIEEATAGTHR